MNPYSHSYRNGLYNTWKDMRRRCRNQNRPDYKWYGGKGIKVCPEWESFDRFVQDMLPSYFQGATLNRLDNNKDYNKENCTWITMSEQQENRSNVYGRWKKLPEMQELRRQGLTIQAIADRLSLPAGTVNWYLWRYGH